MKPEFKINLILMIDDDGNCKGRKSQKALEKVVLIYLTENEEYNSFKLLHTFLESFTSLAMDVKISDLN